MPRLVCSGWPYLCVSPSATYGGGVCGEMMYTTPASVPTQHSSDYTVQPHHMSLSFIEPPDNTYMCRLSSTHTNADTHMHRLACIKHTHTKKTSVCMRAYVCVCVCVCACYCVYQTRAFCEGIKHIAGMAMYSRCSVRYVVVSLAMPD